MKKALILAGLFLATLLPILFGIFHAGFFLTDDGNWMVIRLASFYETLRMGQFPVRFLLQLNNGYGYPVADFLYPLFLYIGSFIHIFHIPYVMTVKILFALSLIGSATGMYLWLRKHFGTVAPFIGALVYTLFPYHVWDITKRGSLGEVLAMGIAPFVFWQIDEGSSLFTGISIGFLILSHNTLALLFLPVMLCYMLLEKKIKLLVYSFMLGLGLSAFFWIPALFDTQFTVFRMTAVSDFSHYFLAADLYPLIGIISFVVILLSLLVVFKKAQDKLVFFLCVTLLSISLTAAVSKPLWVLFHLGTYVQFPFRFLSLTALGIGFLSAYVITYWKKEYFLIIVGIFVILLYVSSFQFFFAKTYQKYPDAFYSTNQDSTTVHNEYMPKGAKQLPMIHPSTLSTSSSVTINKFMDKGTDVSFQTSSSQAASLTLATVYFPGWQATVDKNAVHVSANNPYGFIQFSIPKGTHAVHIWFGETPMRLFADMVSLLSLCIGVILLILRKRGIYV